MTIRTDAELIALFADQQSGGITPEFIRDLWQSVRVYGGLGSLAQAQTTVGTSFEVLPFGVSEVSVAPANLVDTTNHAITNIPCDMEIDLRYEIAFKGGANRGYQFTVLRTPSGSALDPAGTNGVAMARMTFPDDSAMYEIVSSAQVGTLAWGTTINASQGDSFQLAVRADAAGSNFTLVQGRLSCRRVG